MLTDTHCHLDFEKFDADRPAVLERAWETGLTRILIPGLSLPSSRATVALAASHPNLFAAVGVHPNDALTWTGTSLGELRGLARGEQRAKIVAVGEIGLDYYWNDAPHTAQKAILGEQLKLAAELGLPVILHLREKDDAPDGDCTRDLLDMLGEWVNGLRQGNAPLAERPGVLHSYSGNWAAAQRALELGFFFGFTGPITYKNAEVKREVVANLPLERILIETDAPFLAPAPQRGKRNEPAFVAHIADKIAEIHQISREQAAEATTRNAARLFGWGG